MENEVELEILDLAVGGDFVADEIGDEKTSKVFVRHVISGERIRARVSKQEKTFRRAELLEVLDASEDRIAPRCQYFGVCGGCDLQHITIDRQRQLKFNAVKNTFAKKLPDAASAELVLYGEELPAFNYRSRLKLHVSDSGEIGFYQQGSKALVAIDHCEVATEQVNTVIQHLHASELDFGSLFARVYIDAYDTDLSCVFTLRSQSVSRNKAMELLQSLRESHSEVRWDLKSSADNKKQFPEGQFFQANQVANNALQALVLEGVSNKSVIDLYAGAGNFSIPLAENGVEVVAVEINKQLVRHGQALASQKNVSGKLKFVCNPAERFMQHVETGTRSASQTLVLDPPRTGARDVVRAIQDKSFPEIVYVSCSLPDFIRDCGELLSKGYALEKVTCIDMFPQTHHIELVAVLRR